MIALVNPTIQIEAKIQDLHISFVHQFQNTLLSHTL
jgi:hypothetical protein